MRLYRARFSRTAAWLLLVAVLGAVLGLMTFGWPLGPDYYFTYRQVSRQWLNGDTQLYDAQSAGFYNAPWTLVLTVPLSLLPLRLGSGLLNTVSLLIMLVALLLFRQSERVPLYALALPLANPHTFDLLIRGQIDAFILLGVALGWFAIAHRHPLWLSVALWLISLKPTNVLLVIALFLWAVRRWPVKDWIKACSLPLVSFVASWVLIGFDWPVRYWTNLRVHPPLSYVTTTIWRGASYLGVPRWPMIVLSLAAVVGFAWSVRREGLSEQTLSIALATNLLITPYALGYHYVLLALAIYCLALGDRRAAVAAYLVTWSPMLRLRWGFDIAWIDTAYPTVLLGAHWFRFLQGHRRCETLETNKA